MKNILTNILAEILALSFMIIVLPLLYLYNLYKRIKYKLI